MPTYATLMADGRHAATTAWSRASRPTPAWAGTRWPPAPSPASTARPTTPIYRTGEANFNNRTSFSAAGTLQADTLAAAAERAGKKVAQVEWVGGANAGIAGPTVDFANFFSTRGVLAAPLNATEQAGAAAFGISYQVAAFAAASGWTQRPGRRPGGAAAADARSTVATTFAAQNPNRTYDLYVYDRVVDGTAAYDRVILVRSRRGQGRQPGRRDLGRRRLQGDQAARRRRPDRRARRPDGRLLLEADHAGAGPVELQAVLHVGRARDRDLRDGGLRRAAGRRSGEDSSRSTSPTTCPTSVSADFAPLEARIIDEDTYVQQGRDLEQAYGDAVLELHPRHAAAEHGPRASSGTR